MKNIRAYCRLLAACMLLMPWAAGAEEPERSDVDISMAGFAVQYMPVTVAVAKGYFAQEGLNAKLETFQAGGGSALEALIGGSTDAVVGYYDHTLQMQVQGKHVRCVALVDALPGLVLAVRKDLAGEIKTIADLKGHRVGVTELGGNSYLQLRYLLGKAGVPVSDVTVLSVGSGATSVAAIEHKQVDALTAFEPGISMLERRGLVSSLIDARTVEGTIAAYGSLYPSACLYTTDSFIQKNPVTVQRMVNAVSLSLAWMHGSTPEQVVAALPDKFLAGDRATTVASVTHTKPGYPATGRFDPAVLARAADVLAASNPKVKRDAIKVDETFTNRFVDAVPAASAAPKP